MKYSIRATFTLEADSKQEALESVAACISYWDEESGINNLQGVGGAKGYVTITEDFATPVSRDPEQPA